VIGWLAGGTRAGYASFADAFRKGLNDIGYVEGRNVVIEYRRTDGQDDRAAELAEDLVRRQVAVIAAAGTPAAFARRPRPRPFRLFQHLRRSGRQHLPCNDVLRYSPCSEGLNP
jgi:hypothetical protein